MSLKTHPNIRLESFGSLGETLVSSQTASGSTKDLQDGDRRGLRAFLNFPFARRIAPPGSSNAQLQSFNETKVESLRPDFEREEGPALSEILPDSFSNAVRKNGQVVILTKLSAQSTALELLYLQEILRLLHHCEFVVLVEYTEVIIPLV